MFTPPAEVTAVLAAFAPLFTQPSWLRAQALLCGVLLAPANHTVTAALRALGLADDPGFQRMFSEDQRPALDECGVNRPTSAQPSWQGASRRSAWYEKPWPTFADALARSASCRLA